MSGERPLILVSNDDGYFADGLLVLAEALASIGEVVTVAPDRNQSAVSHKISLYSPVRAHEVRKGVWVVDGTPTDCVYLGVVELLGRKPDLVVSGINAGPNLSQDVHYSGTVSAAIEGTMLQVPSIAVSATKPSADSYASAARFVRHLGARVLEHGLPQGITLNVNVPPGDPKSFALTRLGIRPYELAVDRRTDPRGRTYFWIGGEPGEHHDVPGSDCNAVAEGIISVTPLMMDLTAHDFLGKLRAGQELDLRGVEGFEVRASP